ncbi:MAG: hypothetical protein KC502_03815 [Myxococcales bacterium]|nr:hypothetical protein [Myxococcales bacterium]
MLLMAFADGELTDEPEMLAEAQALMAAQAIAASAVSDMQLAKEALRLHVMSERRTADADLSMVRGRVLTKIPAPKQAQKQDVSLISRLFSWTQFFDTGQLGLAGGVAMAAVLFAVVMTQNQVTTPGERGIEATRDSVMNPGSGGTSAPVAKVQHDDDQPGVIIEDMELDGGTVMFEEGENPDEAMIIWHIQPDEGGAG